MAPVKEKTLVSLNEKKSTLFRPPIPRSLPSIQATSCWEMNRVYGLNYLERADSLLFWGTGDPSLLHSGP